MIAAGVFSKHEFALIDKMEELAKKQLDDKSLNREQQELAWTVNKFISALENGDSISAARIDWERSNNVNWEESHV